jgi:predicted amidohydrolase YtcJ
LTWSSDIFARSTVTTAANALVRIARCRRIVADPDVSRGPIPYLRPTILPKSHTVSYHSAMHRRDFLLGATAACVAGASTTRPTEILYNGNIFAAPEGARFRSVQAVAINDGKIIASGSNGEIRALAGPDTKKSDLGGKTVLPGFIDSHTHIGVFGVDHLRSVDCDLRSIAEIQKAIRERASQTAKGEWIRGFKYDDTKTVEGRKLTRQDLDAAAPYHAVIIGHRGGHTGFANSLALQKLDFNDRTPDPAGGQLGRNMEGHLTGELRETAMDRARGEGKPPTRAEKAEGVQYLTKLFAKSGITSVHDTYSSPEDLLSYQDAFEAGQLSCRLYAFIFHTYIDRMLSAGIRTGFGNDWVRVGGMKLICDGSISERTARMSQAYIGRPDDYGILVMPEADLYELARKAHVAGWQVGIHANGDVGIDIALKVYERLAREHPRRNARFRLEHCTLINDDLLQRIKALDAIPTPFWTYVYYHGEKMKDYGPERLDRMFAMRSFLSAGIRVAPGSDYVPGPFEPMMALQSCVTRTDAKGNVWGAKQTITVAETIRASTRNGAYASFEESSKGSLEPGMFADLVVLGRNPFVEDPSTLRTIPVERTMVGGRWVYQS